MSNSYKKISLHARMELRSLWYCFAIWGSFASQRSCMQSIICEIKLFKPARDVKENEINFFTFLSWLALGSIRWLNILLRLRWEAKLPQIAKQYRRSRSDIFYYSFYWILLNKITQYETSLTNNIDVRLHRRKQSFILF